MKIDFDARKNMSVLAYYYSKLKGLSNKIYGMHIIYKVVKNWYDVIFFKLGIKKRIIIKVRNGHNINIDNIEAYKQFRESKEILIERINELKSKGYEINLNEKENIIEIKKFDRNIKFYFDDVIQAINTINMIKENFIDEQFKNLDVKAKDVVDIGANIGDTAIYFALKGANHVYAFEPYPYSYEIALKNIELNNLKDKITMLNEGCGKSGFITISSSIKSYAGNDLKDSKIGKKIKINSLEEITTRFKLNNALLKSDCEGCEYDIILRASEKTLKKFNLLVVDYHYGYKNLVKKLREANFKVKYNLPKYFRGIRSENKDMYVGLILAELI